MKNMISGERQAPESREVCRFLSEYCGRLLGHGATCLRMEKNVKRIADAYGKQAEITISPRHVHISILNQDKSEFVTAISSSSPCATSFDMITRLSRLSWEIADDHIDLQSAWRKFRDISAEDRQNKWLVSILVSFANMAFCRLFGGDAVAMCVVWCATFAGYCMKQYMLKQHVDIRLVVMVCAFVSSVLGATDYLFSLGATPALAVGTSILYLVPGVPFLNSFSDILGRYYICSFSRFMDAVVLTVCLSVGLCAGMVVMKVGMF